VKYERDQPTGRSGVCFAEAVFRRALTRGHQEGRRFLEYRKKTSAEGTGFVMINRELSFLRKMLNVAADEDPPLLRTI